ncbi:sulfatase family protein [Rhodopirellula baltica]|uniref:Mucin-desulfating sulfatase (N-acetylglucosamine-6-sulfatase) n=1 Tax=Rhodopirellula baltica SWK14 TaxID=993516 RepID=L7CGN4_RHOBT|nr:sulfatase [Rhodopirellula baltica]ELP32236.1 mucin-desulfating sulfatase (N-acetylglucosamine-6-sulfatase) [Rhodopirellula baltica SWK14]
MQIDFNEAQSRIRFVVGLFSLLVAAWGIPTDAAANDSPPNILFILCDDHRFDCLGVAGHPFLETPHIDTMARDGAMLRRAYVTTSLCSPSRASILTGQYAHNHRVVDNYHAVDPNLVFFPESLQDAGYQTAFIGKWHMGGDIDDPQRGFDHWVSFRGQGTYWPDGHGTTREVPQTTYDGFNVNGKRVPQRGYITDELTEYSLDWLKSRDPSKPFFLYVSHKAVHADFVPADRHRGRYDNEALPIEIPTVEAMDAGNKPMWVRNQRNSRHGVDFGYNLPGFSPEVYYRRYCESLLAVDDSVGQLREFLKQQDLDQNTIVVYMGDNGFQFGDHGLIDKRTAYEASAKVPLLVVAPGKIPAGVPFDGLVGNIDIAPTLLEAANASASKNINGQSVWQALCSSDASSLKDRTLLYEYYWERNYPHTPTLHAVIGGRFKYIRCHGLWDRDELYDLESDPGEMQNLIDDSKYADRVESLNQRLWQLLKNSTGMEMPLLEDHGPRFPLRHKNQAPQAAFPKEYFSEK